MIEVLFCWERHNSFPPGQHVEYGSDLICDTSLRLVDASDLALQITRPPDGTLINLIFSFPLSFLILAVCQYTIDLNVGEGFYTPCL